MKNGISHLSIPVLSPDVDSIEVAWDQLWRALDHHDPISNGTENQHAKMLPGLHFSQFTLKTLFAGLDKSIQNWTFSSSY